MEIDALDILLLFILAIALAMIIGMNVLYVVDKKLSDIQINVPACPECPKPVCPQPICSPTGRPGSIYETGPKAETETKQTQSQTQNNLPKHSETETNLKPSHHLSIERFEDVRKSNEDGNNAQYLKTNQTVLPMVITQNNTPTNRETILLKQGYNSIGSDKPNTGDMITYPSSDDIVRYNGPGCYQDIDTKNVRKLKFDEINNKTCRPYTGKNIKEDSYNTIKTSYISPSSNNPDRVIKQDVKFYVPRVYMGIDPYMSGVSYAGMSIEIPADIDQIGSIPVNDYDGEPVPVSAFMDSDD